MQRPTKNRLLLAVVIVGVALTFSLVTLVLIDSWIKYLLFAFEISVILLSIVSLSDKGLKGGEKKSEKHLVQTLRLGFNPENLPCLLLAIMATLLLVFIFYGIDGGIGQLFLAMVSCSFLVGYAILSIIKMQRYLSRLEYSVVSFLVSIAYTGFLFVILNVSEHAEIGIIISFLVIGTLSFLVNSRKEEEVHRPRSISRPLDAIAISACLAFYLIFVLLTYPNASSLIGSDISRHFAYSVALAKTPDLYSAPFYFLFHSFEGSVFLLSGENQPTLLFISSFAFLNTFLPLSVYVGAKRLMGRIDQRIPGLVVIFYTFLSNFSFFYFLDLRLSTPGLTDYYRFIGEVSEKSYFGVTNLLQPFHFVVPFTISVIGLIILLSLMTHTTMPRYRYIGIFSFLTLSLSLIHVPEIALFGLLVSVFSIMYSGTFFRVRESLVAITISFPIAATTFVVLDTTVFQRDLLLLDKSILVTFLSTSAVAAIALICDYKGLKLKFVRSYFLRNVFSKQLDGLVIAVSILYMAGIVLWFFMDFKASLFIEVGVVPSFVYPVILGVVGLLSIFSIRTLRDERGRTAILFLLFAILFLFVAGKVLSFININYLQMPYWEKRIPILIFLFASMLAPFPVINLRDHFRTSQRNKTISIVLPAIVVASVFLIGFSSLATQVEYWYNRAYGSQRLDAADIDAVEAIREIMEKEPSTAIISPSEFSKHVATFTTSPYVFTRQDILLSSKLPEVPLMILGGLPFDRIYIYIHNRDLDILDTYSDSWFSKRLLPSLPLIYKNEKVKIYNASGLRFPQSEAIAAVMIPDKKISDNWLYAYNTIAKSLSNYTEIVGKDMTLGRYRNIILTKDPAPTFSYNLKFPSERFSEDFWKIRGQWEQKDDGLYGLANYSSWVQHWNLLLSDFTTDSNDTTVSSLLQINNAILDRKSFTFTFFIFPWKNQTSFSMAGVGFKENNVYAYFADMRNSKVTFYPQFPYSAPLQTGLKWHKDSVINMTISKNGPTQDLYINGTKYLSRTIGDESSGYVGIGTLGTNNIIFKTFNVSARDDVIVSSGKYYDYVANGGNLTVYNTDGYGAIFDLLMQMTRNSVDENNDTYKNYRDPWSKENKHKPQNELQVTTGEGLSSAHKFSISSSPNLGIINANLEDGNILYLDVHALIKNASISEGEKSSLLEKITSEVLAKDYGRSGFNFRKIPMTFQSMNAVGDIYVNTSFVAFPDGIHAKISEIKRADEQIRPLLGQNLSSLKLNDYDNSSIHSHNMSLTGKGSGMYVDLTFGGGQAIDLIFDRGTSLQTETTNGSRVNYENVTSVLLEIDSPTDVVTRTPIVGLDGNATFGNLYTGLYEGLPGIIGRDASFEGNITFSILSSDSDTITDNVLFDGRFDSTARKYDEVAAFLSSGLLLDVYSTPPVVIVLFIIPFALCAVFIYYRKIL